MQPSLVCAKSSESSTGAPWSKVLGRVCRCTQGGVIVVGGNSKYDVPLNLYSLAMHNQSVLGVHRGTRKQLQDLVHLVATEKVSTYLMLYNTETSIIDL